MLFPSPNLVQDSWIHQWQINLDREVNQAFLELVERLYHRDSQLPDLYGPFLLWHQHCILRRQHLLHLQGPIRQQDVKP